MFPHVADDSRCSSTFTDWSAQTTSALFSHMTVNDTKDIFFLNLQTTQLLTFCRSWKHVNNNVVVGKGLSQVLVIVPAVSMSENCSCTGHQSSDIVKAWSVRSRALLILRFQRWNRLFSSTHRFQCYFNTITNKKRHKKRAFQEHFRKCVKTGKSPEHKEEWKSLSVNCKQIKRVINKSTTCWAGFQSMSSDSHVQTSKPLSGSDGELLLKHFNVSG